MVRPSYTIQSICTSWRRKDTLQHSGRLDVLISEGERVNMMAKEEREKRW